MSHKVMHALPLTLLALFPFVAGAQVEKLTQDDLTSFRLQLPDAIQSVPYALKVYLSGLQGKDTPEDSKAIANGVRVANDLKTLSSPPSTLLHYAVPPMSELQRLPDAYPLDGQAGAPVRIIAAKDEYEPGSFVLYPFSNLGKVTLTLSPFKNAEGKVFPAGNLDLKVIKVWYQNGNGWYSYFGDTGLKLTPELLLNDEDLIRVDTDEKANYAREKNGKSVKYRWITPYLELDSRYDEHYRRYGIFSPMKKSFADADTLQPVTLNAGEFKQFFLTAHVPADAVPGTYQGEVVLSQGKREIGKIPVILKVLPFTLPSPKSYFDLEKDYLTASYSYISFDLIMAENGGDRELAEKQYLEVMKNQKAHNQLIHWLRGDIGPELKLQIDLLKQAGMMTDPLLGSGVRDGNVYELENGAIVRRDWFKKNAGHNNVFLGFGDEPGAGWLMNARPVFEAYQKEGFKFIIAGGDAVFYKTGYVYDFHNVAKFPEDDSSTKLWNQVNHAWVAWYATHHVGPENPAFNRRQYGMAPYLSNYSATCNYAHHFGPYNDRSTTYKPMVLAYGQYNGVIDTLAWEGYREGIDDIRYATLLKQLALKAAESSSVNVRYAGRKALQFFASLDPASSDLNATRLEMIDQILNLQDILEKNK